MAICESCCVIHDGSYASGRFCSSKCSRSFSTKAKRLEINAKISAANLGTGNPPVEKICLQCSSKFIVSWKLRGQVGCSAKCGYKWKFNSLNPNNIIARMSEIAMEREFGGTNSKARMNYVRSDGSVVHLQSSYEVALAKDLDANKIEWIRPSNFKYVHDGKTKRYYPDFYLPEYDLYLDPKNDYLIKVDEEKINLVKEIHGINIHMLSKTQLTWEYVKTLAS